MKKFGSALLTLAVFAAIMYGCALYKSKHPGPSVITVPAHVVAYTPGDDYAMIEDDQTKVVSQISSTIDPNTHKSGGKISPNTKVGDKGTLFIEFPARRMEFEPDAK
jgi:hypothetical protein